MNINPLDSVFTLGKSIIERVWPDPNKRAEEMRKLEELKQKGDLAELNAFVQLTMAQIKTNQIEAAHKSLFVAGARPFIIWVGGFAMAWSGVIHPLLTWVWAFAAIEGTPPPLIESAALTAIVTGLLGVGGMRSFDKSKRVETNSLGLESR